MLCGLGITGILTACGGGSSTPASPPLALASPTPLPVPTSPSTPLADLPDPTPTASAPSPLPPTLAPTLSDSVTLPLFVRTLQLGSTSLKLLGVQVNVAGEPAELLLDTGSSGLRIFANAVGSDGLQRTGEQTQAEFGDGTIYDGEIALAPVQIGSIATEQAIRIQVVDTVTCSPSAPGCPGQSGFSSFSTAGFSGILGVSINARTSNLELFSPLTRLPGNLDSGYIIETGGFNATQGSFILGLTSTNRARFNEAPLPQRVSTQTGQLATFSDGTPIWADAALRPSYRIDAPNLAPLIEDEASSTLFDTGSSDITLEINRFENSSFILSPGVFFQALLPLQFNYAFQTTSPLIPGLDRVFVSIRPGRDPLQILGMPFFFEFDTLFDSEEGSIGFSQR